MEQQSTITPTSPLKRLNTVSVNEAITETRSWRDVITPFMKNNVLRGFFIPYADIKAIADMHEVEGMRAYFCLKDPKDFSSISLLVVPVGLRGNDIISTPNLLTGEEESTVYDFTRPCPDFCDEHSLLY